MTLPRSSLARFGKRALIGVTAALLSVCSLDFGSSGANRFQTPNATKQRSANSIRSLPPPSSRFALIIGVEDYSVTEIGKLTGPNNDAKSLKEALIQFAGFPQENITLLASNQAVDFLPTQAHIMTQLVYLVRRMPQDGLLLIAFSGHGMEHDGDVFLLPQDASNIGSFAVLEGSSISLGRLKKAIYEVKSVKQILMLLDACREDPNQSKGLGENPLTTTFVKETNFDELNTGVEAYAVLFATDPNHRAFVETQHQQGYFSLAFEEALKGGEGGKAMDPQGQVTLETLTTYVQETVSRRVRIDRGKEQKPFANIEGFLANKLVLSVPGGAGQSEETVLKSAEIRFHTRDDDKDADTMVRVLLKAAIGSRANNNSGLTDVAILPGVSGLFSDNTDSGPFKLDLRGTTKKSDLQHGRCTIAFFPNGHDNWRFDATLELTFSDGSKLSKNWTQLSLSDSSFTDLSF